MKTTHYILLKLTFTITLYFIIQKGAGQNLVTNGDFEDYITLPGSYSEIDYCRDWNNAGGLATPDYFHLNGTGPVQLPNSELGTVNPYSGSGIAGFYTYMSTQVWHEFISCSLSSPTVQGDYYLVSFRLVNGTGNHSNGTSTNHIGMRFSEHPLKQTSCNPIPVTPQIDIKQNFYSTTWKTFSFYFVADSAYQYITIGNFYTDAQTNIVQQYTNPYYYGAYYFIDKIEVNSLGAVVITLEMPNLITPNNNNSNDLFTPIKSIGITSMQTQIYNRWGSQVYQTENPNIEWDGDNNSDGIYFWNIQYTDFFGNKNSKHGIVQLIR